MEILEEILDAVLELELVDVEDAKEEDGDNDTPSRCDVLRSFGVL